MTLGNISEMMTRTADIVQHKELTEATTQTNWTITNTTPGYFLGTLEPYTMHPIRALIEKFRLSDKIDVTLCATDDEVL